MKGLHHKNHVPNIMFMVLDKWFSVVYFIFFYAPTSPTRHKKTIMCQYYENHERKSLIFFDSVSDPDPDWIRIRLSQ